MQIMGKKILLVLVLLMISFGYCFAELESLSDENLGNFIAQEGVADVQRMDTPVPGPASGLKENPGGLSNVIHNP